MYQYCSTVLDKDKEEVTEYFNNNGFERWNKIYSESDEVNDVQRDIRTGHGQTIEKVKSGRGRLQYGLVEAILWARMSRHRSPLRRCTFASRSSHFPVKNRTGSYPHRSQKSTVADEEHVPSCNILVHQIRRDQHPR